MRATALIMALALVAAVAQANVITFDSEAEMNANFAVVSVDMLNGNAPTGAAAWDSSGAMTLSASGGSSQAGKAAYLGGTLDRMEFDLTFSAADTTFVPTMRINPGFDQNGNADDVGLGFLIKNYSSSQNTLLRLQYKISATDGSSSSFGTHTGINVWISYLVPGTPYHIVQTADGDEITITITDMAGGLMGTATQTALAGYTPGGALLQWKDYGTGENWTVDNFVVPEPVTMSLLALGGLTMLRRRRYA